MTAHVLDPLRYIVQSIVGVPNSSLAVSCLETSHIVRQVAAGDADRLKVAVNVFCPLERDLFRDIIHRSV